MKQGYQVIAWQDADQEAGLPSGFWGTEPSAAEAFEQEIAAGAQRAVLLDVSWDNNAKPINVSKAVVGRFRFDEDEIEEWGVVVRVLSRYELAAEGDD